MALFGCDGSRDRLLAELQSVRPEERALAVKKLAAQAKPEDLVLFTQASRDPSGIVRSEALAALGKSQDPRVVDILGEALGDPDESVQAKAAMALAEIRGDKAKAYLTMQYARRSRGTRQAIVQALQAANVPGAMAAAVAAEAKAIWERNLAALGDGSLPERVGAAEELGKSGRAEAINRLVPLLEDSQVVLASAAVRGLGNAGDKRAVGPISELLAENFPELREAACESLLKLGDVAALPQLTAVALERSSASALATAAILALPPSDEANQALCDITLQAGASEAIAAGREMRHRGGCPLETILDKLRTSSTQANALTALSALGPSAQPALPRILPLLSSSDANVRRLAVDAVTELGDLSAAPAVLKRYEQELKGFQPARTDWIGAELPKVYAPGFDPNGAGDQTPMGEQKLKQAALFQKVEALNAARSDALHKTLLAAHPPKELVPDASDEQLRLWAHLLRALGRLKAPGALELLRPFADDDNLTVRGAALAGLASLGAEGLQLAQQGLTDTDHEVQKVAAQALAEQGEEGQKIVLAVVPRLGDKTRLLEALNRVGITADATATLEGLLREGGADAAHAAHLLGELRAKAAVDTLINYLENTTGVARKEVLLALGKIGDPKAAAVVGKDLYHDSPDVRAAAAEALATLGAGPHQDALDALKGDYFRRVREAAQAALAKQEK